VCSDATELETKVEVSMAMKIHVSYRRTTQCHNPEATSALKALAVAVVNFRVPKVYAV
jgi:hypothetical protein